jgi:hypothetical protein
MATIAAFVASNIPVSLRHTRDFTGDRGWISLGNQIIKRLQTEGLFDLDRKVETGVEVRDSYWITIPTDCVEPIEIYFPALDDYTEMDRKYRFDIVNGKIKIDVPFDDDTDPDTFTLSAGSTTQITINDDNASADEWENYILVPTNGTYRTPLVIGEHAAATGGVTVLDFMHTQDAAIDSTAGYLTQQYLMLVYRKRYAPLTLSTSEIPINSELEDVLTWGMCMLATPVTDKQNFKMYHDLFEQALQNHMNLAFTPTPDQARPRPRSMAGLENCDIYDRNSFEYIGEE